MQEDPKSQAPEQGAEPMPPPDRPHSELRVGDETSAAQDDTSQVKVDPLADVPRDRIVSAYIKACDDVWGGETPPGYLRRFTRRRI